MSKYSRLFQVLPCRLACMLCRASLCSLSGAMPSRSDERSCGGAWQIDVCDDLLLQNAFSCSCLPLSETLCKDTTFLGNSKIFFDKNTVFNAH